MATALYTLSSALHNELCRDVREDPFIREIQAETGEEFLFEGEDFSSYGTHGKDLIYIRTGGTEGLFKKLGLKGEILLLTSGKSNSLAASMEILAWLRSRGQEGEILHGHPAKIAERLKAAGSACAADTIPSATAFVQPLPKIDLGGVRLGVIGKPSDWLIASDVDYADVRARLNAELVDVPMEELLDELKARAVSGTDAVDLRSFKGSELIYEALRGIIVRHRLEGITIRCFDLLDTVHNTGCLALARLNAEGIPSSCEGDIPALLTMVWLQQTYGCPGFQCNLSRIDGDNLLFAHCTVPLSMVRSYSYMTHFESGIGTAIKGELPETEARICKFSPDLRSVVSIPCRIVRNLSEPSLCRTQILVQAPGASEYFLRAPLANHHIISVDAAGPGLEK